MLHLFKLNMGNVILAELRCHDCKQYFKRAVKPGWQVGENIHTICKYNNNAFNRCSGTAAEIKRIITN